MNMKSQLTLAMIVLVFFLLVNPSHLAFGQETHPGGTWGTWLTLPQYPKLQMRVKCEYWIADQNDNNRAHSVWAIQYRSTYARPMDVVQANTYYDTVLNRNKNWNAPGQFTIQPGQTADYGETSVLGACPKTGGASPINLAVYCVVPSGQVDQSPSCQAHGVPKVQEPGSATASGSSSSAGAGGAQPGASNSDGTSGSGDQKAKNRDWICELHYRENDGQVMWKWKGAYTEVFQWYNVANLGDAGTTANALYPKFQAWFEHQRPGMIISQGGGGCFPAMKPDGTAMSASELTQMVLKGVFERGETVSEVEWTPQE